MSMAATSVLEHPCYQSLSYGDMPPSDMDQQLEVKTTTQLLSSFRFLGLNDSVYYYIRSLYPTVSQSTKAKHELTTPEEYLSNFFKCAIFHQGCYFSTPTEKAFLEHLKERHDTDQKFCLYCTQGGVNYDPNHQSFDVPEELVEHMLTHHQHLSYQCNLCLYRAMSLDHVFIHQICEHLSSFSETLKQALAKDKDKENVLFKEAEAIQQLTENKYTPQDNAKDLCKIIICDLLKYDKQEYQEYYYENVIQPENWDGLLAHCAYCDSQGMSFWSHAVWEHPDLPIMGFHSDLGNIEFGFEEHLGYNLIPRTFSPATMQNIFENLKVTNEGQVESTTGEVESQGTKRKLEENEDEQQEEEDAKEDNDQKVTKRRRILPDFTISDRALAWTKKAVNFTMAAVAAFGAYHLTHFLPDSVQNYLN